MLRSTSVDGSGRCNSEYSRSVVVVVGVGGGGVFCCLIFLCVLRCGGDGDDIVFLLFRFFV